VKEIVLLQLYKRMCFWESRDGLCHNYNHVVNVVIAPWTACLFQVIQRS